MNQHICRGGLRVAKPLVDLIESQVLPVTDLSARAFWAATENLLTAFSPKNRKLLEKRESLQKKIDGWHTSRRGQQFDPDAYREFLQSIGYIVPEPAPFQVNVDNVDEELAEVAGPQLVVPVLNARFLLNAANARWGSLYDALYGTDAIVTKQLDTGYDPERGTEVVRWAKDFLDKAVPLKSGSHSDVDAYQVESGELIPALARVECFAGYCGDPSAPTSVLLRNNGLHIELVIDRSRPVGRADRAGIADVLLESAVTTIADLEDSVAAVDGEDKAAAYANWFGLLRGDLEATFEKNAAAVTRRLAADRIFKTPTGETMTLPRQKFDVGPERRTSNVHTGNQM